MIILWSIIYGVYQRSQTSLFSRSCEKIISNQLSQPSDGVNFRATSLLKGDCVQCPPMRDINKLEDDKALFKCTLLNLWPWLFQNDDDGNIYDRGDDQDDHGFNCHDDDHEWWCSKWHFVLALPHCWIYWIYCWNIRNTNHLSWAINYHPSTIMMVVIVKMKLIISKMTEHFVNAHWPPPALALTLAAAATNRTDSPLFLGCGLYFKWVCLFVNLPHFWAPCLTFLCILRF